MIKLGRIPLFAKILLGMVAGVIVGYMFYLSGYGAVVTDWIKPVGTIFIRLLKLVAIPLVFVSLVKGVAGMKDIARLSRLGTRTILVYLLTTVFAVLLGMGMVSMVRPGDAFPAGKTEQFRSEFNARVEASKAGAEQLKESTVMDFVVDIVPENVFLAVTDNSKMLQIIFVALLFGIGMVAVDSRLTAPLLPVIDAVNIIILKIVDFIMLFAPVGVFGLMAGLVVDFGGDREVFSALGLYALTVVVSLFLLAYVFYPVLIKIFTRTNVLHYLKSIFPIQLLAFSTSSSAATLPFTMEQMQKEMGTSEEVASFVLPVGTTINMDGTSCYQSIAILFIAQIFGIDLSLSQMLSIVFLTVMASIGTPGIPGGSVVMTVMVMSSVGIPLEGLALILGIDRPLDMLRTVVNVTGDTFVATLMDEKSSNTV